MMIELLFDSDCPNVPAARENLRRALVARHLPVLWAEWDRQAPGCPDYVRRYGSPTILVDGSDVAGEPPVDAPSCRLYFDAHGHRFGAPPLETILAALGCALPYP